MCKYILISAVVFFLLWSRDYSNKGWQYVAGKAVGISIQDTLKRDTLRIDTISISRELLTADSIFRFKQKEYRIIYLRGDNKKPVQINPLGGILININKIFNHFSKEGKQARRLQHVFKKEYNDDLVNGLWKPYAAKYTGLKGDSLFVFQTYFKPDYKLFSEASHYEKLYYILQAMRVYGDSSSMIHETMRLPKINLKLKRD